MSKLYVAHCIIWVIVLLICFGFDPCDGTTKFHRKNNGKIRKSLAALFRNAMSQMGMSPEVLKKQTLPIQSPGKSNSQIWNLDVAPHGDGQRKHNEDHPFQNVQSPEQLQRQPFVKVPHHHGHFQSNFQDVHENMVHQSFDPMKAASLNQRLQNKPFPVPPMFTNGLPMPLQQSQQQFPHDPPFGEQQMRLNNNNQHRFDGQIPQLQPISNDLSTLPNQQTFPKLLFPQNEQRFPNGLSQNQPGLSNAPQQNQDILQNGPLQQQHRFPNGPPLEQNKFPNGVPPEQNILPNGALPEQNRFPNDAPPEHNRFPNVAPSKESRFPNGAQPELSRFPNGAPPEQKRFPNGAPLEQNRFPNGAPTEQKKFPNGTPPEQNRFPNGAPPEQNRFPNGAPPEQKRFPNGAPPEQNRFPNGAPPEQNRFPNGAPPEQNRFPNGAPPEQNRFPNGAPPEQNRFPNGGPLVQNRFPPQEQLRFSQDSPLQHQNIFLNAPIQDQHRIPIGLPQQQFPNIPPQVQLILPSGPPHNQQGLPNNPSQNQRFPKPSSQTQEFPNNRPQEQGGPIQNQLRLQSAIPQTPQGLPTAPFPMNEANFGVKVPFQNNAPQQLPPFVLPLQNFVQPGSPNPAGMHQPSMVEIRNHGNPTNHQHSFSMSSGHEQPLPNLPPPPPPPSGQTPPVLPQQISENQLLSQTEPSMQFRRNPNHMPDPNSINREVNSPSNPFPIPHQAPLTPVPNEMLSSFPRQEFNEQKPSKSVPSAPVLDKGPWIPMFQRSHFGWKPSDGIIFSKISKEHLLKTSQLPTSINETALYVASSDLSDMPEEELYNQMDQSIESLSDLLDTLRSKGGPRNLEESLADYSTSLEPTVTTERLPNSPMTTTSLNPNHLQMLSSPENHIDATTTPYENLEREFNAAYEDLSVLNANNPEQFQRFQDDENNFNTSGIGFSNDGQSMQTELNTENFQSAPSFSENFNLTDNSTSPSFSLPFSLGKHFRDSFGAEMPNLNIYQLLSQFQTDFKEDFPTETQSVPGENFQKILAASDSSTEIAPQGHLHVPTAEGAEAKYLPEKSMRNMDFQYVPNNQSQMMDFFSNTNLNLDDIFSSNSDKDQSDWSQRKDDPDNGRSLGQDELLKIPLQPMENHDDQSAYLKKPPTDRAMNLKPFGEDHSEWNNTNDQILRPTTSVSPKPENILQQLYMPPLIYSGSVDLRENSTSTESDHKMSSNIDRNDRVKKHNEPPRKRVLLKRQKVRKHSSANEQVK